MCAKDWATTSVTNPRTQQQSRWNVNNRRAILADPKSTAQDFGPLFLLDCSEVGRARRGSGGRDEAVNAVHTRLAQRCVGVFDDEEILFNVGACCWPLALGNTPGAEYGVLLCHLRICWPSVRGGKFECRVCEFGKGGTFEEELIVIGSIFDKHDGEALLNVFEDTHICESAGR